MKRKVRLYGNVTFGLSAFLTLCEVLMQAFGCIEDVWAFLQERGLFHIDLSLGRMHDAIARLGPRKPACVVQVLGTNGKGSTSTFLANLCHAHGLPCGLYTSPHFVSPKERIRGFPCDFDEEAWLEAANNVLAVDQGLTYFEFMTLVALELFCQRQVQVAVLEAGLGGAHDATTATHRDVLCYTPIALDHCALLGPTLTDIALDKAQAMASGHCVVSACQYPAARAVLERIACKRHLDLQILEARCTYEGPLGLCGSHQRNNAALALATFERVCAHIGLEPNPSRIKQGLAEAFLPGRLQRLEGCANYPPLILDGAHNPHGMQTMLRSLDMAGLHPKGLVFSCLGDKDWQNLARLLKQRYPHLDVHLPLIHNERALDPARLSDFWDHGAQAGRLVGLSVEETLKRLACTHDAPYLLTGSLYLLSEFFSAFPHALLPEHLEE